MALRLSRPPDGDSLAQPHRSCETTKNPHIIATNHATQAPNPISAISRPTREANSQKYQSFLPAEFKETMHSIIARSPNPRRCADLMQSRFDSLLSPTPITRPHPSTHCTYTPTRCSPRLHAPYNESDQSPNPNPKGYRQQDQFSGADLCENFCSPLD
jgi:hypothetical protein